MRKIYKRKKSQSTLEYAVLIAIVAISLIIMQIYFKRSVQGKIRATSDDIGDQFSTQATLWFETNSYSKSNESVRGQVTSSSLDATEWFNRFENLQIFNYDSEPMRPPVLTS